MGVKELWQILAPVQRHVSLAELRGKTLAIDLSIWVCEVQGIKQMQGVVIRPYLRNLFFRVSHLVQLGVKLVFIIDGEPPEVKWGTMVQRQLTRTGRGRLSSTQNGVGKQGRSHFKAILKECCEMLDYLGIPYIHSSGEAEALCAQLDNTGIVDGCVTNDGDAFLYGAQTVYRNFTMDRKDSHVECYTISDVKQHLELDREKLIGLALLLGCDYCPKGVPGVGKELAIKFMKATGCDSVLEMFQHWHRNLAQYIKQHSVQKVSHCKICQHPGSARVHEKDGCQQCRTTVLCELQDSDTSTCRCEWHQLQQYKCQNAAEFAVRHKALLTPGFPDMKVIEEFLNFKEVVHSISLEWRRPQPFLFQYVAHTMRQHQNTLELCRIVKTRVKQGLSCLEVEWHKPESDTVTPGNYYVTLEDQSLFQAAFPLLVETFECSRPAKKCSKKQRKVAAATDVMSLATDELTAKAASFLNLTDDSTSRQLMSRMMESNSTHSKDACPSVNDAAPVKEQEDHESLDGSGQDELASDDEEGTDLPLSQRLQLKLQHAVRHGSGLNTGDKMVKQPCHPSNTSHLKLLHNSKSGIEQLCAMLNEDTSLRLSDVNPEQSPIETKTSDPKAVNAAAAFGASQLGNFNIDLSLLSNVSSNSLPDASSAVIGDVTKVVEEETDDGQPVAATTIMADDSKPVATTTVVTDANQAVAGIVMAAEDHHQDQERNYVTNTFVNSESPLSLAERLKLRLKQKRALAGLHSMKQ